MATSRNTQKIPTIPKRLVSDEEIITELLPVPSVQIKFIVGKGKRSLNRITTDSGSELTIDNTRTTYNSMTWQNVMIKGTQSQIQEAKMRIVSILLNRTKPKPGQHSSKMHNTKSVASKTSNMEESPDCHNEQNEN